MGLSMLWVVSDCISSVPLPKLSFCHNPTFYFKWPKNMLPSGEKPPSTPVQPVFHFGSSANFGEQRVPISQQVQAFASWVKSMEKYNVPNEVTISQFRRRLGHPEATESFYGFKLVEVVRRNSRQKYEPEENYWGDNHPWIGAGLPSPVYHYVSIPDYCFVGENRDESDSRRIHDRFGQCSQQTFHASMQVVEGAYLEFRCGVWGTHPSTRWRAYLYQPVLKSAREDVEVVLYGEMKIRQVVREPGPGKPPGPANTSTSNKRKYPYSSRSTISTTQKADSNKRVRLTVVIDQGKNGSQLTKKPQRPKKSLTEDQTVEKNVAAGRRNLATGQAIQRARREGKRAKKMKDVEKVGTIIIVEPA